MTHPLLKGCWDGICQRAAFATDGRLNTREVLHNLDPKVSDAIEAKAFLYAVSHDLPVGQQAVRAIFNFTTTLVINPKKPDACRDMGRAILTTAIVYDWCYELLGEPEKQLLIGRMEALAAAMEIEWPKLVQGSVVGHGVEAQLSRDMLACGIATYDEKPTIYTRAAGRLLAELIPARNYVYPSAAHPQGSAYGPYRFQWEMYTTLLFAGMGHAHTVDARQGTVPYRWVYTRRPDGQLLRDGDDYQEQFNEFGRYWPLVGLARTASYYHDPILMGEAIKQQSIGKEPLFDFLLITPLAPSPAGVSGLPLTRYFPQPVGSMVARTGWDEGPASNAVVADLKVGTTYFGNHQHLDAGSFQLYYKGPLAVQSGIYQGTTGGYGSSHFKNYSQRTIAHNTLLVYNPDEKFSWHGQSIANDGGQHYPAGGTEPVTIETLVTPEYHTGDVLTHDFGPDSLRPEYSYLKGELAAAYGTKVKSCTRSFVFLNLANPAVPAALIVFDRVSAADKSYKKTWLLHCVQEPTIAGNTATVNRDEKGYAGRLVNVTLLPAANNLVLQKIGGPGQEYSVAGQNFPQAMVAPNNSGDGATWRVEASPKQAAATDMFLNVMQVLDVAPGAAAPVEVEKVETPELVGTGLGDRLVLFSKTGALLAGPFTLAISGEKPVKVLIADVSDGTWQVEPLPARPGSPALVISTRQLLYFNAKKGSYRLSKVR